MQKVDHLLSSHKTAGVISVHTHTPPCTFCWQNNQKLCLKLRTLN